MKRWLVCLLVIVATAQAYAHDPNLSGLRLVFWPDRLVVTTSTHISRLAKSADQPITQISSMVLLGERIKVLFDGKPFLPKGSMTMLDKKNDTIIWQVSLRQKPKHIEVLSRLYPEDPDSKLLISIAKNGVTTEEVFLDAQSPSWSSKSLPETRKPIGLKFLTMGIQHILSGPDHVLFVLGIILLGGTSVQLLKVVTAFTLAHSLTLTLAAFGILRPAGYLIEPLIALSIIAIAIENIRRRNLDNSPTRDFRLLTVFAFGLIHGFGFAGALFEAGVTGANRVGALFTFNLGVEVGQAAIILVAAPLITLFVARKPDIYKQFAYGCSILIGLAGCYWLVTRLFNTA